MISKNPLLILLSFLVLFSCSENSLKDNPTLNDQDRAQNILTPLPYSCEFQSGKLSIINGLTSQQSERIPEFLRSDLLSTSGDVELSINFFNSQPQYSSVEQSSYSLSINSKGIQIVAHTYGSLVHALQSLRQLIFNYPNELPYLNIYDKSRYAWRGIMIDASRHWIPKEEIKKEIDAMSLFKMNVLHLHLTDNQGFRIESTSFPLLHEKSSNGNYFTQADIKELIEYAGVRGIIIVPEFDVPGHASGFLTAYPALGSKDTTYHIQNTYGVFGDAMNPFNDEVYTFFEKFLGEMSQLFPSDYIHVGGDEANPQHWLQNEEIVEAMKEKGLKTSQELQAYFIFKVNSIIQQLGKRMIGWDEVTHPQLSGKNIMIQGWRTREATLEASKLGFTAINSAGWYLDHKLHASQLYQVDPQINPESITIEPDSANWQAYKTELNLNGSAEEGLLFLFGEKGNLRGMLRMMNRINIFQDATMDANNHLKFTFKSAVGDIDADMTINNDQLDGSLKLALFNLAIIGSKIGGSDMPDGIRFPNFKKSEPPTQEQLDLIVGGEACAWTEWIDQHNIHSRIWPTSVAIAEKLWSPSEHVNNTSDLYRRLHLAPPLLSRYALECYEPLDKWARSFDLDVEKTAKLTQVLHLMEEVKYYERWNGNEDHKSTDTLNNIADVVMPESLESYEFDQLISKYLEGNPDQPLKDGIIQQLNSWAFLYTDLKEQFMTNPRLTNAEIQLIALSDLSKIAYTVMTSDVLRPEELEYYLKLKAKALTPIDGVILAPAASLVSLIDIHLHEI